MSAETLAAITAVNRKFMDNITRQDAASMGSLYTNDGQLLPAHSDVVTGPAAIAQFWGGALGMGIRTIALETVELETHGDTAVEVGRYTLAGEGDQTMDKGKYLVVWKNDGGAWKLHRDIWTSSMPPG